MSDDELQGAPYGSGPFPSSRVTTGHGRAGSDPSREPDWDERARQINLALTLKTGIHEADAGFDRILSLNKTGLKVVRQALKAAFYEGQGSVCELPLHPSTLKD